MKKCYFLLFFIIIFSQGVLSQFSERVYYLRSNLLDFGGTYQSFKIGETTLTETSLPIQFTLPITDKMSVSVSNAYVLINRKATDSVIRVNRDLSGKALDTVMVPKETTRDLNTITDTRIGFKYLFLDNKGLLNIMVNLPTGKKELEDTAFNIETQLGLGMLKYRIPLLGQGFNVGGSFVYGLTLNKKNILGFGAFFNYKTKYKPVQSVDYTPGSDYGFSISYIFQPSNNLKLNFDANYGMYSKDKISFISVSGNTEKKIDLDFQAGNKITLVGQFLLRTGSINHLLYVQERLIGNNKQQTIEVDPVTREFKFIDNDVKNGQQLDVVYNMNFPLSTYITLNAQLLGRVYGAGQENWNGIIIETGSSNVYGGGLGLRINIFDNLNFDIFGKYLSGKINIEKEMDLTGMDVSAKFNLIF
jgi:hypothetical protein